MVHLVVGGQADTADPGLGMEAEPLAQDHTQPSKEKTPLGLRLTTQLGAELELKSKQTCFSPEARKGFLDQDFQPYH